MSLSHLGPQLPVPRFHILWNNCRCCHFQLRIFPIHSLCKLTHRFRKTEGLRLSTKEELHQTGRNGSFTGSFYPPNKWESLHRELNFPFLVPSSRFTRAHRHRCKASSPTTEPPQTHITQHLLESQPQG